MRIGVVTTSYPRFVGDPAGGFVAGHVAALRALGHRVEVIAAGQVDAESKAPEIKAGRVRDTDGGPSGSVTRIPCRLFYKGGAPDRIEAAPLSLLAGVAFAARLTAAIAQRRWDSIIAHWLAPSAIASLPSRIPLLAIAHGGDIHTLRRMRLLAPTLVALRARRARLAFVSEELRAIACAEAPGLARWLDQAIVQPMGIAVDHFASLARAPSDPPTIVIAARLVPVKGIDVAIEAMRLVGARARLVIAGDGPARPALQRLAAMQRGPDNEPALGEHLAGEQPTSARGPARRVITGDAELQPRVRSIEFVGELPTNERDLLLSHASVVIVPSRRLPNGRTEGTPMIALEALAAGVPVIASAVGGLGAFPAIDLVPAEDPRALAAAIDRALANPPAPDELRAAVEHLDWSSVASRLAELPG